MELSGRTIAILAEEMYNEFELWYPYYRLKEEGADVKIVGSGTALQYHAKSGLPVKVDASAGEVKAYDLEGVIIPGGYAPDHMRRHSAMVALVREVFSQGKLTAAICHAGWMLASAGVLKGRKATCFFAIKDDVINAGAQYLDAEVVIDGNLITSRTPADLPAFMKAVIGFLKAK
jgi:protease I